MQKIIAVINQKGGVGKTTVSINLSAGLALQNHSTLLIDMDPQAHSTLGIGIKPGSYQFAIHDVLVNKRNIREVILETQIEKLFVVPSHIKLDKAEQQLTPELFREK